MSLRELAEANRLADQNLARLIGGHIDKQAKGLAKLRDAIEAKQLAPAHFKCLPPATFEQLNALRVADLKAIASRMNLKGRSTYKRKAQLIAFMVEHRAPSSAPTYEQLLDFWMQQQVVV